MGDLILLAVLRLPALVGRAENLATNIGRVQILFCQVVQQP